MKRFLIRTFLFASVSFLILIVGAYLTSVYVSRFHFKNDETESNLFLIGGENKAHFKYAFLGNSHARNFARYHNHERMEKLLNGNILNLGKGNAECGVNELFFYLEYAYLENIAIDTIIYIMSPPLLYGDYLNTASNTFKEEPLQWNFLMKYLNFHSENKAQRIFYYIRSKLRPDWLLTKPQSKNSMNRKMTGIDSASIKKIFNLAYLDDDNLMVIKKNGKTIEKTIELAKDNNSSVVLIIPPALFGKWKGHEETKTFCREMQRKYNVLFFDYSMSILEPELYYDHHHLNTDGVVFFTKNYLIPSLNPD